MQRELNILDNVPVDVMIISICICEAYWFVVADWFGWLRKLNRLLPVQLVD